MASDEKAVQPVFFYSCVDVRFRASHIGENHSFLNIRLQKRQAGGVGLHRRTEENVIAGSKGLIDGRKGLVDDPFLQGIIQSGTAPVKGQDAAVRIIIFHGSDNGADDESEADKTGRKGTHENSLPSNFA